MPEERKSSDKEAKTSNIIGAVAVAMALLLALAITIPIKAEDRIIIRTVKAGPYNDTPGNFSNLTVNWTWKDILGRTIKATRINCTGGTNWTLYADRYSIDGTQHTGALYLFTSTGPAADMFYVSQTDPRQNTQIEMIVPTGQNYYFYNIFSEYNPNPDPLGITTRVMTLPTGKYTQIIIGNPVFTTTPDHIFIEYRRYSTDEWTIYAQTEIDPLVPEYTYYGDGTDSEYVTPGYYRARYAWMPAPESGSDPLYSGYVYTVQVGPSFAPDLTYPDITMPDAPEAIQVDATVNPLPHIWSSTMGATLSVMVIAVLGTAVAAYFVYGRS